MHTKAIYSAAANFEKAAQHKPTITDLVNTRKKAILADVASGIRAINALVTSNKQAASSKALQVLDDAFGAIASQIQSMTVENAKTVAQGLEQVIGNAMLYASPANQGMGYDPITNGGNNSPGFFIRRIASYNRQILAALYDMSMGRTV